MGKIPLIRSTRNYYIASRHAFEKNKTVTVVHFDKWTNSVRLSIFLKSGANELSFQDAHGDTIIPLDVVSCKTKTGTRTYFWISFSGDNTPISIAHKGTPVKLKGQIAAGNLGELTLAQCYTGQYASEHQLAKHPMEVRILRNLMTQKAEGNPYERCWIFADRADKADDNAEHFYRFVTSQENAPKCFFLLSSDSSDWPRLQADGFNLIEFGSVEHLRALVGARFVISSQATPSLRYPLLRKNIDDLCRADFVFLQHGIISTDCSAWINNHTYKLFVSSTPTEYAALTAPDGPYNLSPQNVVLTGMPRHDNLYRQKDHFDKKFIAVMPTWRAYLASRNSSSTGGFEASPKVRESAYYANWIDFLTSPELKNICTKLGKKIALLPHPIFGKIFSDITFEDHVYLPPEDISYQEIILRSSLCVTDYSSVSHDMAAIGVPIVHFAFHEKEMTSGRHTSKVDIDKLRESAMGPVVTNRDDLLREVAILTGPQLLSDIYSERRAREFSCCDGQASQRIYDILSEITAQH